MYYDKIPEDWYVGIKSIDAENQSLLFFLLNWEEDKDQIIHNNETYFKEFYDRFVKILLEVEIDMKASGYDLFQQFKESHDNALIFLKDLHRDKSDSLISECRWVLLNEVIGIDLYYNIYKRRK